LKIFIKLKTDLSLDTKLWKPKPYKDNKSRYLWTDAFGVCNFITLYYETSEPRYLDFADALIEDVHQVLGRERDPPHRRLGKATDEHPLLGGLRIGKIDPENMPDGDGQYFHYLTKWAYALNRMSISRSDPKYNRWAIELIKSIHPHFVSKPEGYPTPRMVWKISIDMKRAVVPSTGNLDPFDGYVTYRLVRDYEKTDALDAEIEDMKAMVMARYERYSSDDPLDLGEALWISHFFPDEPWAKTVAWSAITSLESLYTMGYFRPQNQHYRLAFREFGTTLGVQVHPMAVGWKKNDYERVNELHEFWDQDSRLYARDKDITPVMYCSSLIPGVFSKEYIETKTKSK
jgi:hypothetical protein